MDGKADGAIADSLARPRSGRAVRLRQLFVLSLKKAAEPILIMSCNEY